MECYNLIFNKDGIFNKFQIKLIMFNQNKILNKNLIFKKDNFQDKELLEQ